MLNTIAAQDIEEVTVLKDASETAQYGSRGAAGVIVVTTAKGKEGVSNITYNGQFGISHAYKQLQMLSRRMEACQSNFIFWVRKRFRCKYQLDGLGTKFCIYPK